jgi:hypothetical protein
MGSYSSKNDIPAPNISSKEDIYAANIKKCIREIEFCEELIQKAANIRSNHLNNEHEDDCSNNCFKKEEHLKKYANERINYYDNRIKFYNNLKNNVDTTIQNMPDAPPEYDDSIIK